MQVSTERMIARKEGAVGWMIFNNPARHNAISMDMWQVIPEILAGFAADPEIRVVVLRGAGEKAFISGADISQFETQRSSAEAVKHYDEVGSRANQALIDCPRPTIAMIRGYCIGGGLGVALCCDLRIAAEDARFAIPAARLGLGYRYAGVRRLVEIVGPAYAKEIFFTARQFDAREASGMGLVNRVVGVAELEEFVGRQAGAIAENAPLTIAAVKRSVDAALADPAARDLAAIDRAIEACFASEDYREGRSAFMEKRRPRFAGR